jgi:hypothetical protein
MCDGMCAEVCVTVRQILLVHVCVCVCVCVCVHVCVRAHMRVNCFLTPHRQNGVTLQPPLKPKRRQESPTEPSVDAHKDEDKVPMDELLLILNPAKTGKTAISVRVRSKNSQKFTVP